jgi:hypothetical protein
MLRFTIRDVLWLTLAFGQLAGETISVAPRFGGR